MCICASGRKLVLLRVQPVASFLQVLLLFCQLDTDSLALGVNGKQDGTTLLGFVHISRALEDLHVTVKLTVFFTQSYAILQSSSQFVTARCEQFGPDALIYNVDKSSEGAFIVTADILPAYQPLGSP